MARMEGRQASSAGRYEAPKYFEVADVDEDDYEEDDDVPAGDEEAYAASQKENEERARDRRGPEGGVGALVELGGHDAHVADRELGRGL